jgi:hypothetical protein
VYYSRILFSVQGVKASKLLEELIPAEYRPSFVFWYLTPGLRDPIIGDGFAWYTYTAEARTYILGVNKEDNAPFTHEEVLDFLHQYTPPSEVLVTPMSEIKELQEALDRNFMNKLPWRYNLPE